MYKQDPILSEHQKALLSLLQFHDLATATDMLGIDLKTLFEWQSNKQFSIAMRAMQDSLRQQTHLEVTKEITLLLESYRTLQEHMTLSERLSFLQSLAQTLKELTPPPAFEHSQLRWIDTRDAEYWREYKREKEEEEKKAQQEKEEQSSPTSDDKPEEPVTDSPDTCVSAVPVQPDTIGNHPVQPYQGAHPDTRPAEQDRQGEEQVIFAVPRRLTEYEEEVLGMRQW